MRLYCDCIPTTKKVSDCIPTVIMPGLYSDCNCPILNTVGILYQNSIIVNEPDSTRELTDRAIKILDAKYEKADLPEIVETQCKHLDAHQRKELLNLLLEFEDLFDGTLGTWDTEPVHLANSRMTPNHIMANRIQYPKHTKKH